MARKAKQAKRNGLAKEIRRRQLDAARRAELERQALAAARAAELEQIRRTLREAAAAEAARRLLAEALAPTHAYGWKPWGYESPEFEATRELPIIQRRPSRPQLRLIVTRPKQPARSRWDITERHPNLARILAGAAA